MRIGELGGWSAIRWGFEMQLKMSLLENVEVIRIIGMLSNVFEPTIVLLLKHRNLSFFHRFLSAVYSIRRSVSRNERENEGTGPPVTTY